MDASSNIAAQQASSSSSSTAGAAAVFNSTSRLDSLPNELLQHIWIHVDDPTSFALTNKRMRAISQDTLWRAKWFMQRYEPYEVLFYAIARIKVFSQPLLQVLLRFGAPLSRNLVQLLRLVRDFDALKAEGCACALGFQWGRISSPTFELIESRAQSLYGDDIPRDPQDYDSVVYSEWVMPLQFGAQVEPSEQVRRIFRNFNFMPLPLALWHSEDHCIGAATRTDYALSVDLIDAIRIDPALLEASLANGFAASTEQREELIVTVLEDPASFGAHEDSWRTMEKLLDGDGFLRISRQYVEDTVLAASMGFASSPGYIGSLYVEDMQCSAGDCDFEYRCFLHFDRRSPLPFKLQDVIEDVFESQARDGSVTSVMIPFLDEINELFSGWSRITPLFVLVTFLKAERQSVESLDEVKRMMGRHEVTSASIMKACLRNGCRSVTPIRYALKYVEGFRANLQAFVEELLDALLYQPYRGIMLRELDRFFAQEDAGSIDFLKLLASAVEDQAFLPEQLAALESNVTTTDTTTDAAFRSTLGFSFKHENAPYAELCRCSYSQTPRFYKLLEGNFPPARLTYCQRPTEHFPASTRTPWLQGFLRFGGKPFPATVELTGDRVSSSNQDNNLLGYIYEDDEHVAEVILDLLGPRSRAADVLLSHALLNGNQPLVAHLLEHGVALTLEHFRVAAEVSNLLPQALVQSIKRGLPFRSSYEGLQQASNNETRSDSTSSSVDVAAPALDLQFNSSAGLLAHVEQWIKELVSLMSVQEREALAVEKPLPVSLVPYSSSGVPPGVSLSDAVRDLQQHATKLRSTVLDASAQQPEAESSLDSLWEEMRDAGAGDSTTSDIRERITGMLRGFKRTRSDRRAAFKQSPYSYKPIGFRGRFVTRVGYGNETKTHEPQLAPLSDEDSADEDFEASLELDESSDTSSSDSELEDGDGSSEPPLKRVKGNNA